MALAVDSHPQKKAIVEALLARVPLRQIAATLDPPLHFASLQRYKLAVVRPAVKNAHALARVVGQAKSMTEEQISDLANAASGQAIQAQHVADPYLDRIAKHQQTVDDSLTDARAEKDGRTVAALIGADLKGMELDARLTGRLDSGNSSTTNIYMLTAPAIVFGSPSAPEPGPPVIDVTPEK